MTPPDPRLITAEKLAEIRSCQAKVKLAGVAGPDQATIRVLLAHVDALMETIARLHLFDGKIPDCDAYCRAVTGSGDLCDHCALIVAVFPAAIRARKP